MPLPPGNNLMTPPTPARIVLPQNGMAEQNGMPSVETPRGPHGPWKGVVTT